MKTKWMCKWMDGWMCLGIVPVPLWDLWASEEKQMVCEPFIRRWLRK